MATALSPSSQIALRAAVSVFCSGKWDVDAADVLSHIRGSFPIMGQVVERADISRALRSEKFIRDHDAGRNGWKHRDRDHPRWGRGASEARVYGGPIVVGMEAL
ncbi:MAG: hypothetical protein AB7E60_01830 [Sphingobium sp.]